jgi:hypothetical protein
MSIQPSKNTIKSIMAFCLFVFDNKGVLALYYITIIPPTNQEL